MLCSSVKTNSQSTLSSNTVPLKAGIIVPDTVCNTLFCLDALYSKRYYSFEIYTWNLYSIPIPLKRMHWLCPRNHSYKSML